ncbi:UNVERIFIED_CONTAM: hypothetical protein Scaly_2906400 [Sesamum calycinum]|uniref:Uncharacterized protein n=1 Tax=Sesamum calycinum TaxID=2727403 RepID=A0AAW2L5C0_9LAMI
MLKQRAKLRWMKHGDQNSKVFFRKINSARAKQRIFQIMKATGEVLTGPQDVTQEFISYFQSLLGGTSPHRVVDLDFLRSDLKHTLTIDEANLLDTPVTQSDIKDAFFAIDEDSAPGPDGYTSAFFKSAWPVIGHDISEAVGEFFRTGKLLKQINTTLLALIPKNAFVPERSISDNILLAQELLAPPITIFVKKHLQSEVRSEVEAGVSTTNPTLASVPNTNATAPSRPGSERTEDGHLGIDKTGGKEIVLHNSFGALDNTEDVRHLLGPNTSSPSFGVP